MGSYLTEYKNSPNKRGISYKNEFWQRRFFCVTVVNTVFYITTTLTYARTHAKSLKQVAKEHNKAMKERGGESKNNHPKAS